MNIVIGDNLKELRKKKNNTQEELAEFLTVSIAAVSKWERGECFPDIELLPKIAAYYNVSVDDLLGVGEIKKQERIKGYEEKSKHLKSIGDVKNNLALWREAQNEFPNDWLVLNELMDAMFFLVLKNEEKNAREIIKIGEKILAECIIDSYRYQAIEILSFVYARVLKDFEKAEEYAKMAPRFHTTYDVLAMHTLQGEEAIKHYQNNIVSCIHLIIFNIDFYRNKLGDKKSQRRALEKELKFYELLYEDGDLDIENWVSARIYDELAGLSAENQNKNETLGHLSNAAKCAVKHDNLKDVEPHTSFLVNRLSFERRSGNKLNMSNASYELLEKMRDNCYDFCRDDERFIKLTEDLKKSAASGE